MSKRDTYKKRSHKKALGGHLERHQRDASMGAISPFLSKEEFQRYDSYQRHKLLMNWLSQPPPPPQKRLKSDYEILQEHHQFLRPEAEKDTRWETEMARRYYDKLYKEYVISDLSHYKSGKVGFRWRTEAEVIQGRGQFWCGNKGCTSKDGLQSYEVNFTYTEQHQTKEALVKARLCASCAFKLHYKHLKTHKHKKNAFKQDSSSLLMNSPPERPSPASVMPPEAHTHISIDEKKKEDNVTEKPMAHLKQIEAMAWKEPLEQIHLSREEEFDDFFKDMLL
ncbi:putative Protein FRA10AC1-like protein [Cardiosporidium cionae]|uniref:Protein FRA10AC1 n=1 Tax=Cardiosporidium cionae TaxID=476202 RepID=A0ABQ7JEK2_9APIC|nr:putative Protein FRA10AC1-like protein [Cardiosporidium cionae]|eukprot:KAF8822314.1 putative Protein FRA10AC1-like protein [Cardiosporidium cionae]